MQISEIMHKGVASVNINDSVKKVAELMRKEDVGAIPVCENNKPVGFITDRDIVIKCVANGSDLNQPISGAMNKDLVCVKPSEDVEQATKLMADKQISRLLVVDENQRPVGMVSLQDLSRLSDTEKKSETLSEIKKH